MKDTQWTETAFSWLDRGQRAWDASWDMARQWQAEALAGSKRAMEQALQESERAWDLAWKSGEAGIKAWEDLAGEVRKP